MVREKAVIVSVKDVLSTPERTSVPHVRSNSKMRVMLMSTGKLSARMTDVLIALDVELIV